MVYGVRLKHIVTVARPKEHVYVNCAIDDSSVRDVYKEVNVKASSSVRNHFRECYRITK